MKLLLSIIAGLVITGLFFAAFSLFIPRAELASSSIFTVKIDDELRFEKYEYTWNESESSLTSTKFFKDEAVLDITSDLSSEENSLIKSAYYEIDFLQIVSEAPLSTDGSWWYVTNNGTLMNIRNPYYAPSKRNLVNLGKLVKLMESFSKIKMYGKTNT